MFLFSSRKPQNEVRELFGRLANVTTPGMILGEDGRNASRSNRTIPTIVSAWTGKQPNVTTCLQAVTKDISDVGMSLVMLHPLNVDDEVVVGFLLPSSNHERREGEPNFVLATVRQAASLGGRFHQVGLETSELLSIAKHPELEKLIPQLTVSADEELFAASRA